MKVVSNKSEVRSNKLEVISSKLYVLSNKHEKCSALKTYYIKLITFFAAFLFIGIAASAQDNPVIAILDGNKNQFAVDSSVTVIDSIYYDQSMQDDIIKPYSVENIVTLRLNEDAGYSLPDTFTVTVLLQLKYKKENNSLDSTTITLTIHYDSASSHKSMDYSDIHDMHALEVKIKSIVAPQNTNVLKSLLIQNEMRPSRVYAFGSCTGKAIRSVSLLSETTDEIKVRWTNRTGADEYDLEWAYVDNDALSQHYYGSDPLNPDLALIFRNNTTRVSTSGITYSIPLIYAGPATLFIRVRPVKFVDGNRVAADWSTDYLPGGLLKYQITGNGHESKLNWQSSVSFAEDGKKKVVVQYYDGSLRGRQTVTKDNSSKTTVVAQTLYDYQGRPTIQVLPCPTLATVIGFTANFNKAVGGGTYDKSKYDELATFSSYCSMHAAPMDNTVTDPNTATGASAYYSPNNPMINSGNYKYIPDAEKYPFTETEYTQDNTGRISRQGGVGPDYQLGNGHETKYYYAITPDQTELDALFGSEAGDHTHYFKNAVQDANGQFSVSYVDMHGRTIATALSGDTPASLQALTSNQEQQVTETFADATTNTTKGLVMESHKSLLVTSTGLYTFNYKIDPNQERLALSEEDCHNEGTTNNNSFCYDCVYDLEIKITGDCNNKNLPGEVPYVFKAYNITFTCAGGIYEMPNPISLTLAPGNYEIVKTLTLSQVAIDNNVQKMLNENTCKTLEDFIEEAREENHLDACSVDCASCTTSLGTRAAFRENYINNVIGEASFTGSEAQEQQINDAYDKAMAECEAICGNITVDNNQIRKVMLYDMSPPSGQYAQPSATDPFSIFFTGSYSWRGDNYSRKRPLYQQATKYKNDDGTDAKVFINSPTGGSWKTPAELTQEEFISYFQPGWAEALLRFHPEYCKLQEYEETLGSHSYDEQMGLADDFATAKDKGFVEPLATGHDPLQTENTAIFTELSTAYTNYATIDFEDGTGPHTLSMWNMAVLLTECNSEDPVTASDCMKDKVEHTDLTTTVFGSCTGDLDMAWRKFREIYLGQKRNLLYDHYYAMECTVPSDAEELRAGPGDIARLTAPADITTGGLGHFIHFNTAANAMLADWVY